MDLSETCTKVNEPMMHLTLYKKNNFNDETELCQTRSYFKRTNKKLWLLIQAINQIHRKAYLWLAALKTYYKKKLLAI